jgi:transcriptional regulator with XRE-family HTH domain
MATTCTTAGQSLDTWQVRGPRHPDRVATKERPIDRGTRVARRVIAVTGSELRLARIAVGLSLLDVGRAVGLSHSQVGRIERAAHPSVSIMQLARIGSVVGLDLSVRTYPNGSPLRDRAHLALLGRFRDRLPARLSVRSEVPLPIPGDLRAWDLVIRGAGEPIGVEAETRLADIQALERRIALKARDGQISRVLLVVSASRGNRLVVRENLTLLQPSFPVPGRVALAALADGRDPGGSALILI